MKVYRVWNVHDEWQELVYAKHHNTAKWEVATNTTTPYEELRAERLPHMDGYCDPLAVRGHIERASNLQRLSGIFPCARCESGNGDGSLLCAECEAKK